MTASALLARLERVRAVGPGRWVACCPAHLDRTPSLSVRELDDGRVLLHDFSGCSVEDVLAAVGLDFTELFPPQPTDRLPRVKKPWRTSDVLRAFQYELTVAAIALGDVEHDRPVSKEDRVRAGRCRERLVRFAEELCDAAT